MSDPVTNVEIEDVLSSIRRLVSNESRPSIHRPSDEKRQDSREKLMLTPALRIAKDLPVEAEDQAESDKADDSPEATDTGEDQNETAAEETLGAVEPEVGEVQPDLADTADGDDDVEMTASQAEHDSQVEAQQVDGTEARQEIRISELARAFGLATVARDVNDEADSAVTAVEEDPQEQQASVEDSDESAEESAPRSANSGLHLLRGAEDEDDQDTADINDGDDGPTAIATADEAADEDEANPVAQAEAAEAAPDEMPSLSESAAETDAPEALDETAEAPPVVQAEAAEVAPDDMPPLGESDVDLDATEALDEMEESGADEAVLDEDALRELVGEIVRQELQGVLGERITRNIRKLVRREIHRFLAEQDID